MTSKQEIIMRICRFNAEEQPEILVNLPEEELRNYLDYLSKLESDKATLVGSSCN